MVRSLRHLPHSAPFRRSASPHGGRSSDIADVAAHAHGRSQCPTSRQRIVSRIRPRAFIGRVNTEAPDHRLFRIDAARSWIPPPLGGEDARRRNLDSGGRRFELLCCTLAWISRVELNGISYALHGSRLGRRVPHRPEAITPLRVIAAGGQQLLGIATSANDKRSAKRTEPKTESMWHLLPGHATRHCSLRSVGSVADWHLSTRSMEAKSEDKLSPLPPLRVMTVRAFSRLARPFLMACIPTSVTERRPFEPHNARQIAYSPSTTRVTRWLHVKHAVLYVAFLERSCRWRTGGGGGRRHGSRVVSVHSHPKMGGLECAHLRTTSIDIRLWTPSLEGPCVTAAPCGRLTTATGRRHDLWCPRE